MTMCEARVWAGVRFVRCAAPAAGEREMMDGLPPGGRRRRSVCRDHGRQTGVPVWHGVGASR